MELASPAGNIEKLKYAWAYGADAAYIALKNFSLRIKADNFSDDEYGEVLRLKARFPEKKLKLYCALNISFHNQDIDLFLDEIEAYRRFPFDAFIVSDIGMIDTLQKHFPDTALHLSTQANCMNREAVKQYRRLGFKRIVLARETPLSEIREIKDAVPEMELEAFVHGAMCIAYSGRCLLSAALAGRSANAGYCSHTCRWDYRVLEEKERPGQYFPIFEGENWTAILSSKDLCMIDRLSDMRDAGVDALKIEGRMKSVYYTALVTRAYRKALDALEGKISPENAAPFIREVYNTDHREFSTGFYYPQSVSCVTIDAPTRTCQFLGMLGKKLTKQDGWNVYHFAAQNKFEATQSLEVITPEIAVIPLTPENYRLINPETGENRDWVSHGHLCLLATPLSFLEGDLVRTSV